MRVLRLPGAIQIPHQPMPGSLDPGPSPTIQHLEPIKERNRLIPDSRLPGQSSQFSCHTAIRLESNCQHTHHPNTDNELNDRLVILLFL